MAKRKYNTWSQDDMEEALNGYRNGSLKFNEACRAYKIPKPTFRRHLKGLNVYQSIGRPKDLTKDMEEELVRHILALESRFFGITIRDFRHLAYQLAEKYKLPHRFNKEKKLAGWKWYYKFLKNHPEISLRTPEPTSMARCKGFNKKTVLEFFEKYEAVLDERKFTAQQIYNVDETGLSTVHKPPKVLALKGKHQVGAVTSGERGLNTTCVCCMNAAGEFIPPFLIFKRKRMSDDLKRGGPPNTVYTCSESGWITSELFLEWLKHFIKCTRLEIYKKNQILLIMDGHSTHTKNIDAINLARDYGIVMFSLPPHTTHKLQPLDRSFFKPLKQNFNSACNSWLRNHPGSVIKQSNISEILGLAYPRAVCMDTAIHGFESCGLWPCNRFKIRDDEYVVLDEDCGVPSDVDPSTSTRTTVTENQQVPSHSDTLPFVLMETEQKTHIAQENQDLTPQFLTPDREQNSDDRNLRHSPSIIEGLEVSLENYKDQENLKVDKNTESKENLSLAVIRSDIQNISPMCSIQKQKRITKNTTTAQILTESPYKKELEKKNYESKKIVCKNLNKKKEQKVLQRKYTKRGQDNIKIKKEKKENKEENWYCKLCQENRKEDMIQCTQCETWVHELCAGVDKNMCNYFCDDCKELEKTIRYAHLN